jgi:hypothetical protein
MQINYLYLATLLGIEPRLSAPQADVISITLQGQWSEKAGEPTDGRGGEHLCLRVRTFRFLFGKLPCVWRLGWFSWSVSEDSSG